MIKLTHVTIHKYRSFFEPQTFEVDDKITVLVGMNESGKTAALQSLAKTNYFQEDKQFKVDLTQDYPRKELTKFNRQKETDQLLIECEYQISDELFQEINTAFEGAELKSKTFTHQLWYRKGESFAGLDLAISTSTKPDAEGEQLLTQKVTEQALIENWIKPRLPKYWYYDQYFEIEDNISLQDLSQGNLKGQSAKTAHALLEIAGIDLQDILKSAKNNFEDYIAQLEAAAAEISQQFFEYWVTNKTLELEFAINTVEHNGGYSGQIVDRILNTRVKNRNYGITLPLGISFAL